MGKRSAWIAWLLMGLYLIGVIVTAALSVANGSNGSLQQDPAGFLVLLLGFSAFMVVGALIVAHRPSNAIGWIFSAIGLLTGTGSSPGSTPSTPTSPGAARCPGPCWALGTTTGGGSQRSS